MKELRQVGVFWVVEGKLLIDSTPLAEAETYGDHLTHAGSHIDVWEQWRRKGKVSADMEYEDSPRGRVMFNTKTRRFSLLADRCILRDKSVMKRIVGELNLSRKMTETGTDDHYRCCGCPPARWE